MTEQNEEQDERLTLVDYIGWFVVGVLAWIVAIPILVVIINFAMELIETFSIYFSHGG